MVFIDSMIKSVPPLTKIVCGGSIIISLLVHLGTITKFDIFFSVDYIIYKFQFWRIFTNLLYFGEPSIYTFFSILMLYRCCSKLEEHTFRTKSATFLYFLLLGIGIMSIYGGIRGSTSLSRPFITMLLYLWSRYNKNVILLLFGLIPMKAPYVTWYLNLALNNERFFLLLDIMMGESIEYDVLGILIAHTFYYLNEIYPKLPNSKGCYPLDAPKFLEKVVDLLGLKPDPDAVYNNFIFEEAPMN